MKVLLFIYLLWSHLVYANPVGNQQGGVFMYKPFSFNPNETTDYYSDEIQYGDMADALRRQLKQSYNLDNSTGYASTQTIRFSTYGIGHFDRCYNDYLWKTAHFQSAECTIEVSNAKLSGGAYDHCGGGGTEKVSSSHSSRFSTTHGWKLGAKTNSITSNWIGLEMEVEVSGSYTQEYVDQSSKEHTWTFEKDYYYFPYAADAYLRCSGWYLEDETAFDTDGYAYNRQTTNYHELSDHDDTMCRNEWGKQTRNDNGWECHYDTNTYKCTHPTLGILYQYQGKTWENIRLNTEWSKKEDISLPLLSDKNEGISITGFKREPCSPS